ncbi:hypothetical protein GCM10027294_53060 [Marinactinospora endophytica]
MAIAAAIPGDARRAAGQTQWLHAVQTHPEFTRLRSDARHRLLAICRVLSSYADWKELTTRPTWAIICDRAHVSRATLKRWRRWLLDHRLLGQVERGSTPRTRTGRDNGDDLGNRAAEYVLLTPTNHKHPDETEPPSLLRQEERTPRTRARKTTPAHPPLWPGHTPPRSRTHMALASQEARRRNMLLRHLSWPHLRSLLRDFYLAGWTLLDCLYALDHRPDGTPHHHTHHPRHIPGLIRWRLSLWRHQNGTIGMSRSQLLAHAAHKTHTQQEHHRALRALSTTQRATNPHHHAATARKNIEKFLSPQTRLNQHKTTPVPPHPPEQPRPACTTIAEVRKLLPAQPPKTSRQQRLLDRARLTPAQRAHNQTRPAPPLPSPRAEATPWTTGPHDPFPTRDLDEIAATLSTHTETMF